MPRAMDDKTSTCGSCAYWNHHAESDGIHPTPLGECGWWSLPVWTRQYIPIKPSTRMRADDGLDCWLHTKREQTEYAVTCETALLAARRVLHRWAEKYAEWSQANGHMEALFDRRLPPADHVQTLEAIDAALAKSPAKEKPNEQG